MSDNIKCSSCALCCKHFTVPTSTSKYKNDFPWIDIKSAHVVLVGTCKHLDEEGKCSQYENRPDYCREYQCWDKKLPMLRGLSFNELVNDNCNRMSVESMQIINEIVENLNKEEKEEK